MPCVSDEGRDVVNNLALGSGFTRAEWADVIHEFGIEPVQQQVDRGQDSPHRIRTTLRAAAAGEPGTRTSQGALGTVQAADSTVE